MADKISQIKYHELQGYPLRTGALEQSERLDSCPKDMPPFHFSSAHAPAISTANGAKGMGARDHVTDSCFGRYKLVKELQIGSTSEVHLAEDAYTQACRAVTFTQLRVARMFAHRHVLPSLCTQLRVVST